MILVRIEKSLSPRIVSNSTIMIDMDMEGRSFDLGLHFMSVLPDSYFALP